MEEGRGIPERFTVLEEITHNAFEVLLRARDTTLDREVLLKLPGPGARKHIFGKSRERSRVLREARALAKVQHPGVARPLDVIETDQGPLLVMEPLTGETLATRLERDGKLDFDEVLALGKALADALGAVHAVGVVHRGVAEENIYLQPDGSPVLSGSVYAKPLDSVGMSSLNYRPDNSEIDTLQTALPSHPAPEQITGQPADARSDLFGLGCVLYRTITGVPAFPPSAARDTPPDDARSVIGAPKGLSNSIQKCLARSPMARFQTAQALREALDASTSRSVGDGVGRHIFAAGVAVLGVGAVAIALTMFMSRSGDGGTTDGRGERLQASGPVRYELRYDNSRALLIGIGDSYAGSGFAELPNAEPDVHSIAAVMQESGWQVNTLTGPAATRDGIKSALLDLERNVGDDDRVMIYYAGHAERHGDTLSNCWLIPHGARPASQGNRLSWYSLEDFHADVRPLPAKHVLVALDCCYAGRIVHAGSFRGGSGGSQAFRRRFLGHKVTEFLTSAQDEPAADGDPGSHSPFAKVLLAVLTEQTDRGITSLDVLARLEHEFLGTVTQRPALYRFPENSPGRVVLRFPPD